MPTVHFLGRVLPPEQGVDFKDIPQCKHRDSITGVNMVFTMNIVRSEVDVQIDLDRLDSVHTLWQLASDMARACVDIISFAKGLYLGAYLDRFVAEDGTVKNLLFANSKLAGICTAYNVDQIADDDTRVMRLIINEPAVFMLLNDLIDSLKPNLAPVNCARVVDGLRKLVAPGNPTPAWPVFRQMLNLDEAYVTFISEYSKKPRHGEYVRIDELNTTDLLQRTWTIMNRFLEYRKRGNKPLALTDFHLLKG